MLAIITYQAERHALPRLAAAVRDTNNVLIVNNGDPAYSDELAHAFPSARVLSLPGTDRMSRILASRQRAREEFLKGNDSFLWMLDSDVIPPKDALEQLQLIDADLVSGVYLMVTASGKVRPCLYVDHENGARQLSVDEARAGSSISIGAAGLGCTLASRKVMESVKFRLNARGNGEDIMFYRDAISQGFTAKACLDVQCLHMQFPEGDERNKLYGF